MGLSTAISGGIVMVVLIYVILMMPGVLDATFDVSEASTTSSEIESSIFDTDLSISSLSASSGSDFVNFTINNEGHEKLWNFEKFDIIVTFDGASSGRLIENNNYTNSCSPSSGNWCISTFGSDVLDPGLLNEDESMAVEVRVSENLAAGPIIVIVSTDNGVVTSTSGTVT